MKKIIIILFGMAVVPIMILFAILSLPFILASETKAAISLRRFRRRECGNVYLICTSNRNWHDFLKNNVIPVLPDNYRVVWRKSVRGSKHPDLFRNLDRSHVFRISKPYLVLVTPRALLHGSLSIPLQTLKVHPKKSSDVRTKCARIINDLEQDLRTRSAALRAAART
jgi:hypothetical protein